MSPPKTSVIWTYFKPDEHDRDKSQCKICNKTYSRKGRTTTPLKSHLKSMHPQQFCLFQRSDMEKQLRNKKYESVKTLKAKWKNLRDTYKKSKQLQLTSSGQTVPKYPVTNNWLWAEKMAFLDSNNTEITFDLTEQTSAAVEDPLLGLKMEHIGEDEEEHDEYMQTAENDQNEIQEEKKIINIRRRRRRVPDPVDKLKKIAKIGDLVEVACDRIDMEFLGIADTFKKFSVRKQATVRLEITKIITKAQLDELDD